MSKVNTGTWSSGEPSEAVHDETCPLCKGVRFVYPLLPTGKPDYSRVVPCQCSRKDSSEEQHTRLLNYCNLGLLTRMTFASLNPHGRSDNPDSQEKFERAYRVARNFAAEPKGWLVLVGPSGSGKTHLAAAIANQCIEENRPAFYITVPDLLDHIRSSFSPNSEVPYDGFFEQIRNAPLLILDDFGVQSGTPWAKEKLDQLLNHRFNSQLPTVIVFIVPIADLEERIRTRLLATDFSQVLELGEAESALSLYSWAPELKLQKQMTFENFDLKRQLLTPEERKNPNQEERKNLALERHANLAKAYELAQNFAKGEYDGWLVFEGLNGCGKTHLAAAIVNYRYQNKKPALFVVVPDFLDHLRSTFGPESKIPYDQFFESVKSAPLLVLDDFGQQSTTPWAQEKLYQVINYRYNARLTTIITTTLDTSEFDASIASRLADPRISQIFNINVPDYRGDATNHKRQPSMPPRVRRS